MIRQWLDATGQRAIWVDSTTSLGGTTTDLLVPDVIVLYADGDAVADVAVQGRRAWPRARLVVVAGTGWPASLRSSSLRPDVVVASRTLRFTRTELQEWAVECGVEISAGEAASILAATAGYTVFSDAVIQVLAQRGGFEASALAEGCARATSDLSAGASAGGDRWRPWETLLLAGQAGELTRSGLGVVSGGESDSPFSLRAMQDAELLTAGSRSDSVGFPPAVRDALRRRFAVDLTVDRQVELVQEATLTLREHGLLTDAISVASGDRFRATLFDLLGEEWLHLDNVPASVLHGVFAHASDRDMTPELWIARARALIDTAQRDRSVPVVLRDRQLAQRFVDRAERHLDEAVESRAERSGRGDPAADCRTMIAVLRAIEERSAGRHDEADARFQQCLAEASVSDHVSAVLRIHAGLNTFALAHAETALALFAEAGAAATVAGAPRLVALAADLEELMHWLTDDPNTWWRHIGASQNPLPDRGSSISRTLQFVRALQTLELDTLRRLLSGSTMTIDDPIAVGLIELQARVITLQALQKPTVALHELDLAEAALRGQPLSDSEQFMIALSRAEALVDGGDPHRALAVLDAAPTIDDPINDTLSRGRVLLGLGRFDEVLELLPAKLVPVAGDRGRFAVIAHLTLALAHTGLGDQDAADRRLEIAILTGARNHLIWPFVRVGLDNLRSLLDRMSELTLDAPSVAHVVRLRTVWESLHALGTSVDLSDREMVLLERLEEDASVRRIAVGLHVSPNTVKTQLRTLYRKLGVSSREDAIRMARLHGLLPDPEPDDRASPSEM